MILFLHASSFNINLAISRINSKEIRICTSLGEMKAEAPIVLVIVIEVDHAIGMPWEEGVDVGAITAQTQLIPVQKHLAHAQHQQPRL